MTALLFTVGKLLIALYIGRIGVASTFGAAGSLVVLLLWVYYAAQIFLLGAEFTWVYSHEHGSRKGKNVTPANAAPVPQRGQPARRAWRSKRRTLRRHCRRRRRRRRNGSRARGPRRRAFRRARTRRTLECRDPRRTRLFCTHRRMPPLATLTLANLSYGKTQHAGQRQVSTLCACCPRRPPRSHDGRRGDGRRCAIARLVVAGAGRRWRQGDARPRGRSVWGHFCSMGAIGNRRAQCVLPREGLHN